MGLPKRGNMELDKRTNIAKRKAYGLSLAMSRHLGDDYAVFTTELVYGLENVIKFLYGKQIYRGPGIIMGDCSRIEIFHSFIVAI